MTREEIIAKMAEDADTTKVAAKAALDSFIGCVTKTLKKGGKVSLVGFGTFSVSKRAAGQERADRRNNKHCCKKSCKIQSRQRPFRYSKRKIILFPNAEKGRLVNRPFFMC